MNSLSGPFAPVPTPLDRADDFDAPALRRHLERLAAARLAGAVVLGTNGEFPSFSLNERLRIAEAAAASRQGLRLMLGVGFCALNEVVVLLAAAFEYGYDAALCPPPFYFRKAAVAGLAQFFRRVLDASSVPVVLYHIPQATGVPLDDRLLDEIGDHEHLAGIKDSSGSLDELDRLSHRFADRSYLVGSDRLIAACREAGGAGSITAAANVVPKLVASAAIDADAQRKLTAVRDLLDEFGLGPSIKAILRSTGLGEYRTRPPLVDLDARRESELLARFEALRVPSDIGADPP